MSSVIYFLPNLMNYVRLLFMILFLYHIKHRPYVSFFMCYISGLIDSFDGMIARSSNQKSNFGAQLDYTFDKLTNCAQLYLLGIAYPKHWFLFFAQLFVDLSKDVFRANLANYQLKSELDKYSNLINNRLPVPFTTAAEVITPNSLYSQLHLIFLHTVWYAGDFFYWLAYFGAFVSPVSTFSGHQDRFKSLEDLSFASRRTSSKFYIFRYFKELINDFTQVAQDLASDFKQKLQYAHVLSPVLKIVNFEFIFRMIGIVTIIGGFLKFFLNFHIYISSLHHILMMDETALNSN